MRRVPYDSLLRQASLSYPSAQLKRNAYGGMVGWPHWHVIIWGRLVVNWILEKVFSLLDSVFLSFLRWGKNFPLFGELLLTTTANSWILSTTLTNARFEKQGYLSLLKYYLEVRV